METQNLQIKHNLLNLHCFLGENKIKQGDDVIVHSFNLDQTKTIEETAQSFFTKGILIDSSSSILSTIRLAEHSKTPEEIILNHCGRGDHRLILSIPPFIEDVFLGHCKKKYGDSGNQNGKNHFLDFLQLNHIPPEFIAGMTYPNKHGELQFIQNPHYFNHNTNGLKNSHDLAQKLKTIINEKNIHFSSSFSKLDEILGINNLL